MQKISIATCSLAALFLLSACTTTRTFRIVDKNTQQPISDVAVHINSYDIHPICYILFFCDDGGRTYTKSMATSDNNGKVRIPTRSHINSIYITKDGYHSYYDSDNDVQLGRNIALAPSMNPQNLPIQNKILWIDAPGNTRHTDLIKGGPENIYVPNQLSVGTRVYDVKVTLPTSREDAVFSLVFHMDHLQCKNHKMEGNLTLSVENGTIRSHGDNVYDFSALPAVQTNGELSEKVQGRTLYTFATNDGVFGKLYIFSTTRFCGDQGLAFGFHTAYIANTTNELELPKAFDGVAKEIDEPPYEFRSVTPGL